MMWTIRPVNFASFINKATTKCGLPVQEVDRRQEHSSWRCSHWNVKKFVENFSISSNFQISILQMTGRVRSLVKWTTDNCYVDGYLRVKLLRPYDKHATPPTHTHFTAFSVNVVASVFWAWIGLFEHGVMICVAKLQTESHTPYESDNFFNPHIVSHLTFGYPWNVPTTPGSTIQANKRTLWLSWKL